MKDHFFEVFLVLLLAAFFLISCSDTDPYSVEGRIDAVEPAEDGMTARITISGRTFLFTPDTLYVEAIFQGEQMNGSTPRLPEGTVLQGGAKMARHSLCWTCQAGSSRSLP